MIKKLFLKTNSRLPVQYFRHIPGSVPAPPVPGVLQA
jgi:hypothetical protein